MYRFLRFWGRGQVLTIFAIKELHMRRGSSFERGLRGAVVNALKRTRSLRLSTDLLGWRTRQKEAVKRKRNKNEDENENEIEAEPREETRVHSTICPIRPSHATGTGANSHTMIYRAQLLNSYRVQSTEYRGITKKLHEFSLDYTNRPNSSHPRRHSQK